jgi:acyl-CoA dehydrogenase
LADRSFLDWPFFEDRHRAFAGALDAWAAGLAVDHGDTDGACRALVRQLGEGGWLGVTGAGEGERLDVRMLCLAREVLARHDGLADFAFAMQGLGTGALTLFADAPLFERVGALVRRGEAVAAFALTEPASGSDVANTAMTATRDGAGWRLDGEKTWISNGGIADHYVVFARSGEAPGAKGLSAFFVPADAPGLTVAERQAVIAPHPLARLRFKGVAVGPDALIGKPGEGFKVAMATLDVFRATVGAAALGFARRALDAALERARSRRLFGGALAELPLAQAALGDSATEIDAAALLVARAAWTRDMGAARITREASMAKMYATEAAQRVIDRCVQLHGGEGVRSGSTPETLYREIRALRIYEGATEVQKLVIARQTLAAAG